VPFKDRVRPGKVSFARRMHRNPTPSEAAIWERLRRRQLGVPFLSQECILGYIVDFYCPTAQLVVEIDGAIHEAADRRAADVKRDRALRRHGLIVLHLPATMQAADAVARIDRKLKWLQVKRDRPAPIKPDAGGVAA